MHETFIRTEESHMTWNLNKIIIWIIIKIMYKLHNFKTISMLSFEIPSYHKVLDADSQGQSIKGKLLMQFQRKVTNLTGATKTLFLLLCLHSLILLSLLNLLHCLQPLLLLLTTWHSHQLTQILLYICASRKIRSYFLKHLKDSI